MLYGPVWWEQITNVTLNNAIDEVENFWITYQC